MTTARNILITILLLEKSYNPAYISRIITGDNKLPLRNSSHSELQTFGVEKSMNKDFFTDRIIELIKMGFISADKSNLLSITTKGENLLTVFAQ